MSKVKPRVDTTQAPTPAKDEKKDDAKTNEAEADKNADADKADGPVEMDVD